MTTIHGAAVAAIICTATVGAARAEADLARGEYLVRGPAGCGNCHTPLGPEGPVAGMELAGRLVDKNPAFTAVAPNITPGGRIADWSDTELARAIREGIRPDGSIIGPPMPFAMYRGLGDDDLASIVAFLRTVPTVENDVPPSEYNIPLPPAYGPPVESVTPPAPGVTVEYGAYLAGPAVSSHCGPLTDTTCAICGTYTRGMDVLGMATRTRNRFTLKSPWAHTAMEVWISVVPPPGIRRVRRMS